MVTVQKPPLVLEVYQIRADQNTIAPVLGQLEKTWAAYYSTASRYNLFAQANLKTDSTQTWEIDLNLVDDAAIRAVNKQYRGKDEATDVLSFPLLPDVQLPDVPEVQLGSIFISLQWAKTHSPRTPQEKPGAVTAYVLERFVHGMLHLMGQNHDTMEDYRRVRAIQTEVLQQAGFSGGVQA